MLTPQFQLPFADELIVDNFAGGGGVSTGIERALKRFIDIAINHDAEALGMHQANHPQTLHLQEDVFAVDPVKVTKGRRVGLAWFSPDCKHHSKAKGDVPKDKRIRGLAWVVINWVNKVNPRVIILENVEEFVSWGPLDSEGKPKKHLAGRTYESFKGALERRGYALETKMLRGSAYGAPTSRRRFFLIARRDGRPIVWPEATHESLRSKKGKKIKLKAGAKKELVAADCIDFSLPCPSVLMTRDEAKAYYKATGLRVRRPLAKATCRRIAKGVQRFVMDASDPYLLSLTHAGVDRGLLSPCLTEHANSSQERSFSIQEPLRTQCAEVKGGHFALVSPMLVKNYSGVVGQPVDRPIGTVTSIDHHAVAAAYLAKMRGSPETHPPGTDLRDPVDTISAGGTHFGYVAAHMAKYQGAVHFSAAIEECARHVAKWLRQHGAVFEGEFAMVGDYVIWDLGLRMLYPRELFLAQGFPDSYIIDRGQFKVGDQWIWKTLSKKAQVRMCGNSVCPPLAEALVRANVPDMVCGSVAA